MRIKEALAHGETRLLASDSSRLDSELLLCKCLQKSRSYLYTWPDALLHAAVEKRFLDLLERRVAGEPIAYIVEQRMFWSLDLLVDTTVLIPRPETECLVEVALQLNLPAQAQVLDLGTGSGAIALALASERPAWDITASDLSAGALALARRNQLRAGLANVTFLLSDWFSAIADAAFNLIVSNPPYIAEFDPHLDRGDLRFEPRMALVSGSDGLGAIRRIVCDARKHLSDAGWLVVEHGFDQAGPTCELFAQQQFSRVETVADLAGNPRVTIGQAHRQD